MNILIAVCQGSGEALLITLCHLGRARNNREGWDRWGKGKTPAPVGDAWCTSQAVLTASCEQHCASVFLQGLPGFIGPVGEPGIAGEKV